MGSAIRTALLIVCIATISIVVNEGALSALGYALVLGCAMAIHVLGFVEGMAAGERTAEREGR